MSRAVSSEPSATRTVPKRTDPGELARRPPPARERRRGRRRRAEESARPRGSAARSPGARAGPGSRARRVPPGAPRSVSASSAANPHAWSLSEGGSHRRSRVAVSARGARPWRSAAAGGSGRLGGVRQFSNLVFHPPPVRVRRGAMRGDRPGVARIRGSAERGERRPFGRGMRYRARTGIRLCVRDAGAKRGRARACVLFTACSARWCRTVPSASALAFAIDRTARRGEVLVLVSEGGACIRARARRAGSPWRRHRPGTLDESVRCGAFPMRHVIRCFMSEEIAAGSAAVPPLRSPRPRLRPAGISPPRGGR